jgi:energy-coupling factor transporter ATP-binding protein EcfA2
MRSIVTARPTGLDDPSVWNDLRLPLPYPERRRSSTKLPPALERRPVRIETISLHNIRLFDDLSLEPAPPDNGSGQWLVLLGENGVGKSTLLRSFVFALGPVERPGYLPPAAFAAPWRSHGLDIDAPCYIQVRADGHLYRTRIERKNEDDIPIPQDPPSRPLVFAYGARRGSALGGANRDVRFEPGSEIATLFDEGASLIHAETWLLVRKYDAVDNSSGTPVQLWQTIERVLLDMLPGVQRIFIRERRLWFEGEAIGETLITGLSDGYLTTLGWVVDLIARWIELVERRKEPIPERFNEHMTGLVLIDDIDMQLHPDWQRRVIADVRKAFPRMSFVVTTHNPLTLLGARAEEIWQFERNDDGHVTAQRGEQLPALMTAAQILRSYFGINRTFPAPLGEKLQRLAFLVGNRRRTEEEDAEMDRITAELHEAGADPGWVPVPRDPESVRR